MASVDNYIKFVKFYNDLKLMVSAICTEKGGIALENYVGRFVIADVLEFLNKYSERLDKKDLNSKLIKLIDYINKEYEKTKDLTTPSKKPIYEMTLEEFEQTL